MLGLGALGQFAIGQEPPIPAAPTPKANNYGVPAAVGRHAIGQLQDITSGAAFTLEFDTTAYSFAFNDINLLTGFRLPLDTTPYTTSFQDIGLLATRRLPMEVTPYTFVFNDIELFTSILLNIETAEYLFGFNEVTFTYFQRNKPNIRPTVSSAGELANSKASQGGLGNTVGSRGSISSRVFPRC